MAEVKINLPDKFKSKSTGNSKMFFELYVATDDDVIVKWEEFKKEFLKNRFFIPDKNPFIHYYMNSIINEDAMIIKKGEEYYRARIRKKGKEFIDKDLNVPPSIIANAGRLNPRFIPYLYISNDETTVVSEVRPHLGANVVISTCKANKDLKILDLTKMDNDDSKTNSYKKMISLLFSTPYAPDDTDLEYIPTQYITELIKLKGFDGVKYRSAMNLEGENICIFSDLNFDITITKEILIKKINYEFEQKTINKD